MVVPGFGSEQTSHADERTDMQSVKDETPPALDPEHKSLSETQVKRATRPRQIWALITSVLLFISVIFLIMVEIGNTSNRAVLRNIWFIKLNLTNVIPASFPNSTLLNSIARTLGLHDFYQVGLWNFCEGFNDQGVTDCSPAQTLYWFDPVAILLNELLAGATIQLPPDLSSILNIIKVASHWMFALFFSGACLAFVMMFIAPLSVFSRWIAFLITSLTFLAALFITAASVIATAMFIIMKNVFAKNTEVNIGAQVGTTMFALMWVSSACAILAFMIQLCLSCCCASRRDVRMGKKHGSRKAYTSSADKS